ncbi:tryptophan halogenase family protein [Asticcacaulis sp. EMRT-3]|uniref:tryptophan halogenase family protein n=1 Tax=Asticcacaulis sp. EMRT-3 TaxID=3040349 RepID=UPI0032C21563
MVIVGGGTSGWMCAAALSKTLRSDPGRALCDVLLIESEEIGTVGVGEATLPQIKDFNSHLGLNEADFMRRTRATFKLGIEFRDWGRKGNSYVHPFGDFGQPVAGADFVHAWSRGQALGETAPVEAWSYAVQAARRGRFDFPSEDVKSIKSTYNYAYHFDAGLYAAYLREFAEKHGLKRIEGRVTDVRRVADNGDIAAVVLASGEVVEGDLFIDCSGFRGLLIDQVMQAPWQDWSGWLPCDRAVAMPCEASGSSLPLTQSVALEAGWRWRIPLQHRTGNGYVFSSQYLSDDEATMRLSGLLEGAPTADAKILRFKTGRRLGSWSGNCIAIGLASGFLEPLESTSIYLSQIAITSLLQLFPSPDQPFRVDARLRNEFNRRVDLEYDRVRDFLILHYRANSRDDGELWRYVRHMPVPDSLHDKIAQFRRRGYIHHYREGLFSPASWLAVFTGQDIVPQGHDRLIDAMPDEKLVETLHDLKRRIDLNVDDMPRHDDFIRNYCAAPGLDTHNLQGASL